MIMGAALGTCEDELMTKASLRQQGENQGLVLKGNEPCAKLNRV